jgi:hypothetical protein
VRIAAGTDALVHHADACLALARVRRAGGDEAGASQAATAAADLYARKGATALAESARALGPGRGDASHARTAVDDVTREPPNHNTHQPPENACLRTVERVNALWDGADWQRLAELFRTDSSFVDRRRGMSTSLTGRDQLVEEMRLSSDLGPVEHRNTCVATRGERLALVRRVFSSLAPEIEVELLMVYEIDQDGLMHRQLVFDPDDLNGALTELDERYIAGEGAPYAMPMRNNMLVNAAFNARDWPAMLMLYAPDIVVVDRRPASLGEFSGREILVHDVQGMVDVAPNIFMWTAANVPAPYGGVSLMRATATTADGGEVEVVFYAVGVVHDGVVTHLEYFPVDQVDTAIARSHELQAAAAGLR